MNIDWTQLVSKAMKETAAAAQVLADTVTDTARRRAIADSSIAPLQDAVDIDDATDAEIELLKSWKEYRVVLNRLPDQPGYPTSIEWPDLPV